MARIILVAGQSVIVAMSPDEVRAVMPNGPLAEGATFDPVTISDVAASVKVNAQKLLDVLASVSADFAAETAAVNELKSEIEGLVP